MWVMRSPFVTHNLKLQETFTGVASIVLTRLAKLMVHQKKMYYFPGSVVFGILQHTGRIHIIRCPQTSGIAVSLSF
jgi:hypothetical protein